MKFDKSRYVTSNYLLELLSIQLSALNHHFLSLFLINTIQCYINKVFKFLQALDN